MAQQVRAVVARAVKEPVSLEAIDVPDPGPGEALVQVQACGVCHTDLHYREGGINDDFPFLLGHEAAGSSRPSAPTSPTSPPATSSILNWRAVCGECRSCRRGRPWYCFATHNATQKMTLDGVPLSPALGIGAFAEKTLVAAGQCTKVSSAVPAAGRRPARLRRDGRPRRGHAHRRGRPGRLAWRCSAAAGVGDAAIAGSRLAGASTIIAVDLDARKLELAREFGATHVVDASKVDPVEAIRELTGGNGADVCIEAVGHPKVFEQAFYARDLAGTVVQVGVPDPEMRIDLPMIDFFGRGGRLKPSWYGDCLPSRDFPLLVDLHLQGRLRSSGS